MVPLANCKDLSANDDWSSSNKISVISNDRAALEEEYKDLETKKAIHNRCETIAGIICNMNLHIDVTITKSVLQVIALSNATSTQVYNLVIKGLVTCIKNLWLVIGQVHSKAC